jgi:hypothetical protein
MDHFAGLDVRSRRRRRRGMKKAIVALARRPSQKKTSAPCNHHKVRGMQVNYKSAEKYVGDDTLDLLILFPGGFGREVHLNINVR